MKRFKIEQSAADIVSQSGLALIGQAINTIESELFFMTSMAINDIPSQATLRRRLDNHARAFLLIVEKASPDFFKNIRP